LYSFNLGKVSFGALNAPTRAVENAGVLTELGDALHRGRNRETFTRFLDTLDRHEDFEVVPASPELFQRGVELFRARPDKEWSLTDCISFVVMAEKGLSEALTGDRHFEQAGFKPLL